jgi:hypothetical protein
VADGDWPAAHSVGGSFPDHFLLNDLGPIGSTLKLSAQRRRQVAQIRVDLQQ